MKNVEVYSEFIPVEQKRHKKQENDQLRLLSQDPDSPKFDFNILKHFGWLKMNFSEIVGQRHNIEVCAFTFS